MGDDDLINRKIKNHLRRNISNDSDSNNENKIRNQLLSLYYENINGIPIFKRIDENGDEYNKSISVFPYYFKEVSRDKILEIFNEKVSPRKPLKYDYNDEVFEYYNYDIKPDNYLKISEETFRPYYYDDWKKRATEINEVEVDRQHSFYNQYINYFLRFKKFPDFNEFLSFIYYKNKEIPVHKDIQNVYNNIYNSYKEIILNTTNTPSEIRKKIVQSTSIIKRIELQN